MERPAVGRREDEVIVASRQKLEDTKLRHVRALCDKHELELEQLRASLVPTVYVRGWATKFLAYSRGVLLNVPSELLDALGTKSDPGNVSEILRGWLEQTFRAALPAGLFVEDDIRRRSEGRMRVDSSD
jgi:hypothetical protein